MQLKVVNFQFSVSPIETAVDDATVYRSRCSSVVEAILPAAVCVSLSLLGPSFKITNGKFMTTKVDKSFWGSLLTHIVEDGRRTPKFQVERAIGPILGFFLPDAISELLNSERHAHKKGRLPSNVVMLATEFPLKKLGDSKQSTNIDWLMYDTSNNELLLVELKTEFASFQGEQLDRYLELAAIAKPWIGMRDGFDKICEATKSPKYKCAKKQLEKALENCLNVENAPVRVVYLAPKATAASFTKAVEAFKPSKSDLVLRDDSVVFFSFEDFKNFANGGGPVNFASARIKLFKALSRLDRDMDADRSTDETSSKKNYRGLITLDEVLKKCRDNKSIIVGFLGGSKALAKQDLAHLENRLFKWDNAGEKSVGIKIQANWIEADQFLKIVEPILSKALRSEAEVQRLVSVVDDALRNNPKLTLGQIIERVSANAPTLLDELSDDDLVTALAGLAAPK